MMTPNEAHNYTLDVVKELQAAGVKVIVKPYRTDTGHYHETLAKYGSLPDRASPDKWCKAVLKPETDEQKQLIAQKQKHLCWLGIRFDSGGGMGVRHWELDWSFRIVERPADDSHEEVLEVVEDLFKLTEGEEGQGPLANEGEGQGQGPSNVPPDELLGNEEK